MFKVRKKGSDATFTVYAVNGTYFLIFAWGDFPHWEWRSMDEFMPDY